MTQERTSVKEIFEEIWAKHNSLYKTIMAEANEISKNIEPSYLGENRDKSASVVCNGYTITISCSGVQINIKAEGAVLEGNSPANITRFTIGSAYDTLNGIRVNDSHFAANPPGAIDYKSESAADILLLGMRAAQIESAWIAVKENTGVLLSSLKWI